MRSCLSPQSSSQAVCNILHCWYRAPLVYDVDAEGADSNTQYPHGMAHYLRSELVRAEEHPLAQIESHKVSAASIQRVMEVQSTAGELLRAFGRGH